jgi:Zn-dependent protease
LIALMSFKSPIHAVVALASYLAIIITHELGHAWMAQRLGYGVDAIYVAFLHGFCVIDAPHSESDRVLIAWGGVLAQLATAVPILIVATVFDDRDFGYAAPVVAFLGYVNLLIALCNLTPAPSLDGETAWRAVPLLMRRWRRRRR